MMYSYDCHMKVLQGSPHTPMPWETHAWRLGSSIYLAPILTSAESVRMLQYLIWLMQGQSPPPPLQTICEFKPQLVECLPSMQKWGSVYSTAYNQVW